MRITEIACRDALARSGIPGVDYALNPYRGCAHSCVYCYATYLGRWHHPDEQWGTFVDVRVNIADRLARQLKHINSGCIQIGTATDPYQPLERRYELTRACLQRLIFFGGEVDLLTKSDLVLRDADILKSLANCQVGLTVTTAQDEVAGIFEPKAPPPSRRIAALGELRRHGLKTYAFVGPLLPELTDTDAALAALFVALSEVKPDFVYVDTLNLSYSLWGQMCAFARHRYPALLPALTYVKRNRPVYENDLRRRVEEAALRYGLNCRVLF